MDLSTDAITERLKQAQEETQVLLTIDGRPNIVEMSETRSPESCWQARRSMDRYLTEGTWRSAGAGFQQLQKWVELHWNPENKKQAPNGTVAVRDHWPLHGETQLDAAPAARKLITAAMLYGQEQVGKCAVEFAAHGMIEVQWIYLMNGPSIEAARPLDEYCTLLPYSEALRKIDAESDPGDLRITWPEPRADSVCALEGRYFERAGLQDDDNWQYASSLLKDGPEQLALLLGLVWGSGFRVFGNWQAVPAVAVAALPYRNATQRFGYGSGHVRLALQGYESPVQTRPLAITELHALATSYSDFPEQTRGRLRSAMARLRNSTERFDEEDRVLDLGIALSTVFMEEDEQEDQATLIPQRAAWHYADSESERRQTEDMLRDFFSYHSSIAYGRTFGETCAEEHERVAELLSGADDVLRTSLKTMIAEGPPDWKNAADRSSIRRDPPRSESKIPSVKSDSLSWSVEEQKEIDQALEAMWRTIVEEAPLPPPDAGPSTVAGLAPELVESYREQGIPYVVIHPARLYMAHPKWPKTASEPLDERAEYYCALDVARHVRQWKEAALRKGLVQFEVPTEAELYHPKNRDRWLQPLLSSHEENSRARNLGQPLPTGETASPRGPMPATATEDDQHAVEEKAATPASEFSASAIVGLEREWFRLWRTFQHDVHIATNSLLYMLEAIHSIHLAERQRLIPTMTESGGALETLEDVVRAGGDVYSIPVYPKLRAFPSLVREPLFRRSAPDGRMEQLAFKGWIAEVFDLWESVYRTQLKHEIRELRDAIRPRQQVLGDLRHIRNNLLHNGTAKRGEAANCEILRWFTVGERMQMRLLHVFDFLNQMGWLNEDSLNFIAERGTASIWHIDRTGEPEEPPPALISVRPAVNPEQQDPRYRYEASIVFENGLFGRTPMGPEKEETEAQAKERTCKWMKMTVNEDGDLHVPGLGTVSAAELYRLHLKGEKHPAPGIWQPPVQFRE